MKTLNNNETLLVTGGGFSLSQELKNVGGYAEEKAPKVKDAIKKGGEVVGQATENLLGGIADNMKKAGEKLEECDKNDVCRICGDCTHYTFVYGDGRAPLVVSCK